MNQDQPITVVELQAQVAEVHKALYGGDGEPGLIADVHDIKEIINAFRLFGKAVMWIALFLGGVGTAFEGFLQAFKFIKGK